MASAIHPSVTAAAFLSTGLISALPNVLLFLFPNYGAGDGAGGGGAGGGGGGRAASLLSLGQALAAGGLLGDVFLHTLPDCYADGGAAGGGGGGDIGFLVITGFVLFLVLDVLVRAFEGQRNQPRDGKGTAGAGGSDGTTTTAARLSSAALLNLLGDSMHNFTDGLAIGASFSVTRLPESYASSSTLAAAFSLLRSRGGLATVSVLLHEIPHELGDFATLVRAGMTRNAAIGLQFATSLAAFLGTAFGLFSGRVIEGMGSDVLLPFTAGGFLYLACVAILPDVLESEAGAGRRALQISAFLLGVAFMYAVAELEEMDDMGHHHHGGHRHVDDDHDHHGHHEHGGHDHRGHDGHGEL